MLKKAILAATAALSLGAAVVAPTNASAWPDWRHGPGYWHGGPGYWHGGPGYWRGGYGYGGWRSGWGPSPGVFAAGVLGVAVGASLAAPYYGAPPAYYAGPGYWGYYGGCRSYWRWSPGWGRYVRDVRCY